MKELVSNFIQASNERLKNPLIFSFLISWAAFNWKSIFTLFLSEKKMVANDAKLGIGTADSNTKLA